MTPTTNWGVYVDGFNFYYAIKNDLPAVHLHLGWCDFRKLGELIVGTRGKVDGVKYFTAPVERFAKLDGEAERQASWLRAVKTIPGIEPIYGFHNGDMRASPDKRYKTRSEKETDVNIAIRLVLDAARNEYDRAILITGDYDQMPAVEAVVTEFPAKAVEVWLPPGKQVGEWRYFEKDPKVSVRTLTLDQLRASRLQDDLVDDKGRIPQPDDWRSR